METTESAPVRVAQPARWTWLGVGLLLTILVVAWSTPRVKPTYLFPLVIGGIAGIVLGLAARQLHLARGWFVVLGAAGWASIMMLLALILAAQQQSRPKTAENALAREIIAAVEQAEAEAASEGARAVRPQWMKVLAGRYPKQSLWTGLGWEAMLTMAAASIAAALTSRPSVQPNSSS